MGFETFQPESADLLGCGILPGWPNPRLESHNNPTGTGREKSKTIKIATHNPSAFSP
jgi:hypothetical protein